jgi:hypothetical protein
MEKTEEAFDMEREQLDSLRDELRKAVEVSTAGLFPLEGSLAKAHASKAQIVEKVASLPLSGSARAVAVDLLLLLDSTSIGAALAVKRVSNRGGDVSGITTALVDLWGQAEAARSLWFDHFVRFPQDMEAGREPALLETARLLGPRAVSIAMQLHEPVPQYIEFVSKVTSPGAPSAKVNP